MVGKGGDDIMRGDRGKDTMSGGPGNDKMRGNTGDDTMDGGVGFDSVIGGAGIDECSGAEVGSCEITLAPDTDGDGKPDDQDNCPLVANTPQLDRYSDYTGDVCEDSDDDGIFDIDEEDICVSVDGMNILQKGSAVCETARGEEQGDVTGTLAIANGENAVASACLNSFTSKNKSSTLCVNDILSYPDDVGLIAEAVGDGAIAKVAGGLNNTARAEGEFAAAQIGAFSGNSDFPNRQSSDNAAVAVGTNSIAGVSFGSGNIISATADNSLAFASGNNNTVSATVPGSFASVGGPLLSENNTVSATGINSEASVSGRNNQVSATAQNSIANASFDNNQALATEPNSEAYANNGCIAEAPDAEGNLVVDCNGSSSSAN